MLKFIQKNIDENEENWSKNECALKSSPQKMPHWPTTYMFFLVYLALEYCKNDLTLQSVANLKSFTEDPYHDNWGNEMILNVVIKYSQKPPWNLSNTHLCRIRMLWEMNWQNAMINFIIETLYDQGRIQGSYRTGARFGTESPHHHPKM